MTTFTEDDYCDRCGELKPEGPWKGDRGTCGDCYGGTGIAQPEPYPLSSWRLSNEGEVHVTLTNRGESDAAR